MAPPPGGMVVIAPSPGLTGTRTGIAIPVAPLIARTIVLGHAKGVGPKRAGSNGPAIGALRPAMGALVTGSQPELPPPTPNGSSTPMPAQVVPIPPMANDGVGP